MSTSTLPHYVLGKPDCRNITPLTIKLRIRFQPAGGKKPGEKVKANIQGKQFSLGHISLAELEVFKGRFTSVVERQWSEKIYVALPDKPPPFGLPTPVFRKFLYPGLARWRPCVRCRLEIELSNTDYDWWLIVCKPEPGQLEFPSYMFTPDKAKLVAAQNKPQGMLSMDDVKASAKYPVVKQTEEDNWNSAEQITVQQIVAGHEVGHMLGLRHVNYGMPVCQENASGDYDTNDPICYGDTVHKANDAMGSGSDVRARHGLPWVQVLKHETGHKKGWTLTTEPLKLGCATPETLPEKAFDAGRQLLQNTLTHWSGVPAEW